MFYGTMSQSQLIRTYSSGAFNPSQLSLVAWYDPSDLSTMWQDTAATTAVTADGQAVARIDDKSGNGYHMVQGTSTKRPIYKTDGTYHWLLFDGTDDGMDVVSQGNSAVTMPLTWSACSGFRTESTVNQSVMDSDNSNPTVARYAQQLRVVSSTLQSITFNEAVSAFTDSAGAVSTATNYVSFSSRRSAEIEAYLDGVTDGATATSGTNASGAYPMAIGKRTDVQSGGDFQYLNGRIYGAVMTNGDLTTSEQGDLEQWMAEKANVTLP